MPLATFASTSTLFACKGVGDETIVEFCVSIVFEVVDWVTVSVLSGLFIAEGSFDLIDSFGSWEILW